MKRSTPAGEGPIVRRSNTNLAAFVIGLPLAAAILGAILSPRSPLQETVIYRYVSHKVECVEVVMFCCALGALLAKAWHNRAERRACRSDAVPPWDGRPVPVSEAPNLLAGLRRLPGRLQNTYLAQRVAAILDFLCQRRSTAELDDQLRTLTDNDSLALEGSYSLTRFITWAIPILGFLGTVLGITQAIAGATPEKLEHDLSSLTDGLALAFDATALALALTMVTMFCNFLVERSEQGVLEAVDRYVDRHLAHRFERTATESGPLVEAMDRLVQRQAEVWARSLAEAERRTAEAQAHDQEKVTAALEAALETTLDSHSQRLAALEKQTVERSTRLFEQLTALAVAVRDAGREQQTALTRIADGLATQAEALGQLQDGERQLVRLQTVLQENLAALAGAGAFEEAVHNLTAAIHLLTARAAGQSGGGIASAPRPGKAA
jgi:biopolymer transport protein ExbB/TolQ